MEHVMNHARDTSEARGQHDRRMRPQSAFVPRQSYFKHKGEDDDLGRPVLQHKPLAKGEFTQLSLAKVFDDDPGMRPKVFASPNVNKISYALMNHDISGAAPVPRSAPYRPRDTDPNAPRYILPGTSVTPENTPIGAAAAAIADSTLDGSNLEPRQYHHPSQPHQTQMQRNTLRNTLNVSDINAVDSVAERPSNIETRDTQLKTHDIEGSWPGWEPPFRAHVGKNLRDPGLDVSDISGTFRRRRILSARPTLSSSRGHGSSATAATAASQDVGLTARTVHAAVATAPVTARMQSPDQQHQREMSASMSGERQQQWQQQQPPPQSYLPPPLSWQPVQYDTGGQQWSSEGSSSASSGATRRYSHHVRQQQRDAHQQQQQPGELSQQQEQPVVHAAGAWPTTVTLPLRPMFSPPPFATHIPTGSVAAVLSTALEPAIASQTAAVADHPATTVGKATPGRRDAQARHAAKLTLAEVQRADSAEAQRVISSLRPSREVVEEFFSSCRRLDRESCGKVAPTDFMHALERANLLSTLEPGAPGAAAEAATAAKALARGLQDGCGMVSYRYLARALLGQTLARRASSSRVPTPSTAAPLALGPTATVTTTPAAVAPAGVAAAPPTLAVVSSPTEVAAPAQAAVVAIAVAAAASDTKSPEAPSTGDALRSTPSRQTLEIQNGGEWKVARTAIVDSASSGGSTSVAVSADIVGGATGPADELAATAGSQGTRRCVNFAPELLSMADTGADSGQGVSPATPPTPLGFQEQRRLELQERQLRREGSARRRPCSAAPGGPKGAVAVAEVFKLLGASQPILYDTPPPPTVHVTVQPAAPSTPAVHLPVASQVGVAATSGGTGAVSMSPQQDLPKTSTPVPPTPPQERYDGMGFGPHWPPEPRPNNLQKRSTATIMEGSNLHLREVCDVTYYPYKAHALWFGGRVGPDGANTAGGPADAAREYQPSVDPVSFLVGKGHHRVHIPPSGHKLEPEVEAAIVAKLRPKSALGSSPEAGVRARTASSLVHQLHVENPLLYPGRVDPTTTAGEALKGMLGPLYNTPGLSSSTSAGSGRGSGAYVAVRPSTAGSRRSTHPRPASVSKSMFVFSGGDRGGGGAPAPAAGSIGGSGAATAGRVGRVALERQIHKEELAAVRRLC